jgi:hypothetical protein
MTRLNRTRAAALVLTVLAVTAGCGDATETAAPDGKATGTVAATDTAQADAGNGDWLLRFATAEGDDGEQSRAVYVRYNPTTGVAEARALPRVTASDAGQDEQVLLVSADHAWALPDTAVPRAEARTGKLTIYSVTDETTKSLDIRAATGKSDLSAVAWAFDPTDAGLLRVVDADGGVWAVDVTAMSATQESTLPRRDGWIFADGFDRATGKPYIESIDSDETEPAGLGDSDTRPIERQGGTLVRYDGEPLAGLPTPPCTFAGGFQYADGSAWLFCADTPSITAYQAAKDGTSWHRFGSPSPKVLPAAVAELTFALPPVG